MGPTVGRGPAILIVVDSMITQTKPCCTALEARPPDPLEVERVSSVLRALGDPHRALIVHLLAASGEAVCACDLEEHLPLSQPTVSHHLRVLTEAGLLDREQRGRWAYYSLRRGALEALVGHLGSLAVAPD